MAARVDQKRTIVGEADEWRGKVDGKPVSRGGEKAVNTVGVYIPRRPKSLDLEVRRIYLDNVVEQMCQPGRRFLPRPDRNTIMGKLLTHALLSNIFAL